ncbi:UNVERIFIED_CONTAM: hypothetical protein HHA_215710 [Hammondia hammondi]|eukprot:XP_008886630.1 hypothetical protein HHA_215710 [Hammondia hammondi]
MHATRASVRRGGLAPWRAPPVPSFSLLSSLLGRASSPLIVHFRSSSLSCPLASRFHPRSPPQLPPCSSSSSSFSSSSSSFSRSSARRRSPSLPRRASALSCGVSASLSASPPSLPRQAPYASRSSSSVAARSRSEAQAASGESRGSAEEPQDSDARRRWARPQDAQWPHLSRPEVEASLNLLLTDQARQRDTGVAWVTGPVGVGKSYMAQFAVQRAKSDPSRARDTLVLAFGMKALAHTSFPVLLGVFQKSLVKQLLSQKASLARLASPTSSSRERETRLPREASSEVLTGSWICATVEAACPSFRPSVAFLLRSAASSSLSSHVPPPFAVGAGLAPTDEKERHARMLRFVEALEDENVKSFTHWRGLLEFLALKVPSFSLQAKLSEKEPCDATSAAFGLLRMAAAHAENAASRRASEGTVAEYPTGEKWLDFFVALLGGVQQATGVRLSLWIDDVEVLCLSRYLDERGPAFLSSLNRIFLSPRTSFPLVLLTADSLTSIRGICLSQEEGKRRPHRDSFPPEVDGCETQGKETKEETTAETKEAAATAGEERGAGGYAKEQEDERSMKGERRNVEVIEVGDLSRQTVTDILVPRVTSIPEIPRAIFLAVGGNCALVEKITKGLIKLNGELWLEENRAPPADHVKQVRDPDEAELAGDASEEEERDWRWCERQKEFCRNLTKDLLVEDVRLFEWRMQKFLSLPLLTRLREKQGNEIHFLVTVFESLRYFLSKPFLLVRDLQRLDNVVILGLLDAGLLTARFQPSRVQVSSELYRHLLSDYINTRYAFLSVDQKASYNLNWLLNEKSIKYHVDRLSEF